MKLHEIESSSFHLQLVAQVFTDALSGVEQDRRRVYEELEKSELRYDSIFFRLKIYFHVCLRTRETKSDLKNLFSYFSPS